MELKIREVVTTDFNIKSMEMTVNKLKDLITPVGNGCNFNLLIGDNIYLTIGCYGMFIGNSEERRLAETIRKSDGDLKLDLDMDAKLELIKYNPKCNYCDGTVLLKKQE